MHRALWSLPILTAVTACNFARVAGGMPVSSDRAIDGAVLGTWTLSDCRDAAGEPLPPPGNVVRLVRNVDGRFVVVDARPAYDTLIVTNGFLDDHVRRYELALKSSSSAPLLREYSFPANGKGPGIFAVVTKDWDSRETAGGFVAIYKTPVVTCVLSPKPDRTAEATALDRRGPRAG